MSARIAVMDEAVAELVVDRRRAGYGGSYFSPPWISILAIHLDHAGMREPANSLARDKAAWARLYGETLQIVNAKLAEKKLGRIGQA